MRGVHVMALRTVGQKKTSTGSIFLGLRYFSPVCICNIFNEFKWSFNKAFGLRDLSAFRETFREIEIYVGGSSVTSGSTVHKYMFSRELWWNVDMKTQLRCVSNTQNSERFCEKLNSNLMERIRNIPKFLVIFDWLQHILICVLCIFIFHK